MCLSLVWLNAATHLACQHYTTFPRTADSLSLFCYLFKIRIRCVLIWQQSASLLMHHETRNAVLVLLIHMAVWDIAQVIQWNMNTNYNKTDQSSPHNSCLCLMRLWTKCYFQVWIRVFAAIDDWMGMSLTETSKRCLWSPRGVQYNNDEEHTFEVLRPV